MKNEFTIIVAIDKNNGIGKNGDMPWYLPDDLKHFKEVTTKTKNDDFVNVVVMGRKTWESIPANFRPLKNRINVILTKDKKYSAPNNIIISDNFDDMFDIISKINDVKINKIFVIGGQQIFEQAIKLEECREIIVTHIESSFDCDTFFPSFLGEFELKEKSSMISNNDVDFYFAKYLRKNK